jgi:hypothetical protein
MPPSKYSPQEREKVLSELTDQGMSETDSKRLADIILTKASALKQRGIEEANAEEVRELVDTLFGVSQGRKSPKNGFRKKIILFVQQKINSLISPRAV